MKDIIIYGVGGLGRETFYLVKEINKDSKQYNILGFAVDDEYFRENSMVEGVPLYSHDWLISHRDDVTCVCAVGYPQDRRKVMKNLSGDGIKFESIIHPTSFVADTNRIGNGCIIGGYCAVSVGVELGEGVFLNGQVNIGHDSVIEDYVTCFPKAQISGGCHIGEAVLVGSLAYIHEKKEIGRESVIAPGSIVLRNVKPAMHVFGNPARVVKL